MRGCKDVVCGLADWLRKADPEQDGPPARAANRTLEPVRTRG
ncbi:hypothetical protein NKG05_15175 [Oerskovia sp. M15]